MNTNILIFKKKPIKELNNKKFFISSENYQEIRADLHTGFINKLKTFLKKFPYLYSFIFYFIAPAIFLGKEPKRIYDFLSQDKLVIDIGSGNRRLNKEILNVDIYPWSEIDIVADAHDLPFSDNSVDGVIFSWVLEHMKDPDKVVSEIHRILKRGGYFYLSTNFITPYHPSPKDYYRWTADGLKVLLKDFRIIELKPHVGPTCAFLSVFQEWMALALSFNIKFLKDIIWIFLVIITSPFKLLDLIFIHFSSAETITAGFYLVAKKE
jgi:SAM-dependent methyltransferase